jgi:hypothetical protein
MEEKQEKTNAFFPLDITYGLYKQHILVFPIFSENMLFIYVIC